jgi:hypothetical protein
MDVATQAIPGCIRDTDYSLRPGLLQCGFGGVLSILFFLLGHRVFIGVAIRLPCISFISTDWGFLRKIPQAKC